MSGARHGLQKTDHGFHGAAAPQPKPNHESTKYESTEKTLGLLFRVFGFRAFAIRILEIFAACKDFER
jgi:hypothetical protein